MVKSIIMVHPRLSERGGAERKLLLIAKALADRGHSVTILTNVLNPSSTFSSLLDPSFSLVELTGSKLIWFWKTWFFLYQHRADIIVAHNYPANIPVALAKLFGKRCLIVWVCNEVAVQLIRRSTFVWQLYYRAEKALNKLFDIIIANSTNTANRIGLYYQKTAKVIRSGVQVRESYGPLIVSSKVAELKDAKFVLVLSRLEEGKNLTFLPDILSRFPTTTLVIAGAGSLSASIRAMQPQFENLVYLADVTEDEKYFLYRHGTVFAFLPHDEPLGVTVLEAISENMFVVAYNSGGPKETILVGQNGALCENEDEYLNVLERTLTNPHRIASKDGKEYVREFFSNERMQRDFVAVIEEVMK